MTDNKLTDEQVIKALECCSNTVSGGMCPICPIDDEDKTCVTVLTENALDLLKRKDAEIDILMRKNNTLKDEISELMAEVERLKEDISFHLRLESLLAEQRDGRDKLIEQLDEHCDTLKAKLKTAKSKARKKFAERLKEKAYIERGFMTFSYDVIDNLLKEMEGESE